MPTREHQYTQDDLDVAVEEAVAAERERCAKLCDAEVDRLAGRGDHGQGYLIHMVKMAEYLAAAIRKGVA